MPTISAYKIENSIQQDQQLQKPTRFRWFVLAFGFVAYVISGADRANIGFALPFIRKEFTMSNTEAGMLLSLFFSGYALMQIPGGYLISKFGIRKVFSVFTALTSLTTGLISFSSNIFQIKLLRLALGLAEGPLAPSFFGSVNNWFPSKEKGFATGILLSAGKFGPLIVPPLCAVIIHFWGWREIFLAFAIPGLFFTIIWYFMVPDLPGDSRFCSQAEVEYIQCVTKIDQKNKKGPKSYKLVWLDRLIRARKVELLDTSAKLFTSWDLIGSSLGLFVIAAINAAMMSWIPTYLITVKKMEIMTMAFAATAPFAGAVVGTTLGGWLSDTVFGRRRKPLMIVGSLSSALLMYALIHAPSDPWSLGGLLFLAGFFVTLGFSSFISYPMGLATKEKYPIAMGIQNTVGQAGAFLTPIGIGMLLDKYNWDAVLASLAVACVVWFLLVVTIVEPVDDPLV